MTRAGLHARCVAAMAKHLPPSSSRLRLLDIDGSCGEALLALRADLERYSCAASDIAGSMGQLPVADAVLAFDVVLDDHLLAGILKIMRPGGRFIAVMPSSAVSEAWGRMLEEHNYRRILVESAVDGLGVLVRGEKAHATSDTRRRILGVAGADGNFIQLAAYRGAYLHLLIRRRPNKAVWQMGDGERVEWGALTFRRDGENVLLAFSSLPKAVGFLQEAVLEDLVRDVNKVGKFEVAGARSWHGPILLNPTVDAIRQKALAWMDIDPAAAAAPDE